MAGFNNLTQMRQELVAIGITEAEHWDEVRLVHEYDITFLVGRYDFVEESRRYMPRGVRINGRFIS